MRGTIQCYCNRTFITIRKRSAKENDKEWCISGATRGPPLLRVASEASSGCVSHSGDIRHVSLGRVCPGLTQRLHGGSRPLSETSPGRAVTGGLGRMALLSSGTTGSSELLTAGRLPAVGALRAAVRVATYSHLRLLALVALLRLVVLPAAHEHVQQAPA